MAVLGWNRIFFRECSRNCFLPFTRQSSSHAKEAKLALVKRLLAAKDESKMTFDQIAKHCGVTNAYATQLFLNQAKLFPATSTKLREVLKVSEEDIEMMMMKNPMRSFDPNIVQEPLIYRLNEATNHYGEAIKLLVNEKLGDGIMSAIDVYVTVDVVKGVHGEDRIVIQFNGKFLPHVEQLEKNNTAK